MITLGGKAGSGKGTVGALLAEWLEYEIVDIGSQKRALAAEKGISISQFDAMGDESGNEQDFDLKYETYQQSLDPHAPVILDSRLGFYNQPKAFNVFLDVSSEESARRIFLNERATDQYDSLEEVLEMTEAREYSNKERYMKLYKVDLYDFDQYDLVTDTTMFTPEEVANTIMYAYDTWKTAQRGA